jgi:KaiC/GvpD/RAD55 family RecA-like ATPase
MTDKTPMGISSFFDTEYGGSFRGRPLLVSGPAQSGKTVAAFHFVNRGLRLGERCLMLSARPSADLVIQAESMGMDFAGAIDGGQLILLEYGDDVPGRYSDTAITLPPDSFMQLAKVIDEQAVMRLVLDTCLPWVAVRGSDRLSEHVFSFVRSLDRMGVTTMLTMPKAASLAAARLYKLVEDQIPVSISLHADEVDGKVSRLFVVNKYLGMDEKVGREIPFQIEAGKGIVVLAGGAEEHPSGNKSAAGSGVSFSGAVFGQE